MLKLVLGLALIIYSIQAEDYYKDEKGNIYSIGQWGERRYGGGAYFADKHDSFKVDASNILTFGWNLFKSIESPNFVLSPLSPQLLLSYLVNETAKDSDSYNEIKDNIRYKNYLDLERLVHQMLKEPTARDLKIGSAFFMKNEPKIKSSFFEPPLPYSGEGLIDTRNSGSKRDKHRHRRPFDHDDDRYGDFEDYYRYRDRDDYYERYRDRYERRTTTTTQPPPLKKEERPLDVVYVDFAKPQNVKTQYRKWVSDATKGAIENADIEVDQNTEMILASTIYFRGQWLFAFNSTREIDFTTSTGEVKKVEAMTIRKKYNSGRFDNLQARWAAVPYNSTEALVIVFPNEGENIDKLIANMTGSEMTEIITELAGYPSQNWLNITIPKFKINSKIDLKKPLEKMGIKKIFTPQSELTLYEDGRPLKVAAATQQSSLEIDEKGSIGASSTAFSVVALTVTRETVDADLVLDRPFIAVIIDRKYGVPYFIGKIGDPTLRN